MSYAFITMDYGAPAALPGRGGATVAFTGLYQDDVVKVGGHWRFERRSFEVDAPPRLTI